MADSVFDQMSLLKIMEYYGISLTKDGSGYVGSIPPVGKSGKSLHVFGEKTWHCHKNDVGGGILDFIMFMDKCSKSEAFKKACDICNIELEEQSPESLDWQAEKTNVLSILSSAADIFHSNLNSTGYSFIFNKWGITKESADKFKLGFAKKGRNLANLDPSGKVSAGLVYSTASGHEGKEFYQGRITFPYFYQGSCHFMTGRETPITADTKELKYKGLRLNSNHPEISKAVNVLPFFGEDAITGKKEVHVVEGPADCIVLNQYGFPCIALSSTHPSNFGYERLVSLLKNKVVYLCLDNDANGAGKTGALDTGKVLFQAGITTQIVTLPPDTQTGKNDISEFMKGKQAADFEQLKASSIDFCTFALSSFDASGSLLVKQKEACKFISTYLSGMISEDAAAIVEDNVKSYFGFNKEQLKRVLLLVAQEKVKNEKTKTVVNNSDLKTTLLSSLQQISKPGLLSCQAWIRDHTLALSKLPKEDVEEYFSPECRAKVKPEFINIVGSKFKLSKDELNRVYITINQSNLQYRMEKESLLFKLERLQTYAPNVKQRAEELLTRGGAYDFIVKTWQQTHVGDEVIGQLLPLAVASTLITGANYGIHLKISGNSGKGKSDAVNKFLSKILPEGMAIRSGMSDKYLYYTKTILSGSAVSVDDKTLSTNLQEIVKNTVTNFQKPESYRTVIDGEPRDLTPPARIAWIISSVFGFDDDQVNNRFIQVNIDDSNRQDKTVSKLQRAAETRDILADFQSDIAVCNCIYDILRLRTYDIRIPYAESIDWVFTSNRRNQVKFFDLIRAVCLYNLCRRPCINGYYLASVEDFNTALTIFEKVSEGTNTNLTASEISIIKYLYDEGSSFRKPSIAFMPEFAPRRSYEQIEKGTGINKQYIRHIMNGSDPLKLGLQSKINGFGEETARNQQKLFYYYGNADFEKFKKIASLNTSNINEVVEKAIQSLKEAVSSEDLVRNDLFTDSKDYLPSLHFVTSFSSALDTVELIQSVLNVQLNASQFVAVPEDVDTAVQEEDYVTAHSQSSDTSKNIEKVQTKIVKEEEEEEEEDVKAELPRKATHAKELMLEEYKKLDGPIKNEGTFIKAVSKQCSLSISVLRDMLGMLKRNGLVMSVDSSRSF
jgi:DNA primase catalytic core